MLEVDMQVFDPHGSYVYCLYGDDPRKPFYVGSSSSVHTRIGGHVIKYGARIKHVTVERCASRNAAYDLEERLIDKYQPEENVEGRPGGRRVKRDWSDAEYVREHARGHAQVRSHLPTATDQGIQESETSAL